MKDCGKLLKFSDFVVKVDDREGFKVHIIDFEFWESSWPISAMATSKNTRVELNKVKLTFFQTKLDVVRRRQWQKYHTQQK